MKLSSSKNSQILLLVLLIVALLFALYYYVVLPKQSEADSLNRSISSLSSEISTLQATINDLEAEQNNKSPNMFNLSKQVPLSREVDKLLLNIEEIEYVTDSHVMSLTFSDIDTSAADSNMQIETPEENVEAEAGTDTNQDPNVNEGEGTNTGTSETEGETVNDTASPLASLSGTLPTELKLITFNLEVVSPDYTRLLQFIDELESLERIMHVDAINYSLLGEEAEFQEVETESVTASIQVTTFYYEGE